MRKMLNLNEVVLYSTDCPQCKVLKEKLEKANIRYTENNDVGKMIDMGLQTSPWLSVDGVLLEFGNAVRWIAEVSK